MYSRQTAAALAARVRSLVGGADRETVRRVAGELSVAEGDLREVLEYATRYPSLSVLAAIFAAYVVLGPVTSAGAGPAVPDPI